jgi:hypothetical protein
MRDTIEMAREAGIEEAYSLQHGQFLVQFKNGSLELFEALVRADERSVEREACAKVCEHVGIFHEVSQWSDLAFELAEAIRSRGEAT